MPLVGRSSVPMMCSSVDLPEPDGPTIAASSPSLHLERHGVEGPNRRLAGVLLDDVDQLERQAGCARKVGSRS